MSTYKQDREFIASVIGTDLLQNAIDWIASNMSPEDIFTKDQLESWAESNDYKKEES